MAAAADTFGGFIFRYSKPSIISLAKSDCIFSQLAKVILMWIPFGKWIGEISYYLTLFKYELKSKHDMVSLLKAKAHNLGSPKTLIPGIFFKV